MAGRGRAAFGCDAGASFGEWQDAGRNSKWKPQNRCGARVARGGEGGRVITLAAGKRRLGLVTDKAEAKEWSIPHYLPRYLPSTYLGILTSL